VFSIFEVFQNHPVKTFDKSNLHPWERGSKRPNIHTQAFSDLYHSGRLVYVATHHHLRPTICDWQLHTLSDGITADMRTFPCFVQIGISGWTMRQQNISAQGRKRSNIIFGPLIRKPENVWPGASNSCHCDPSQLPNLPIDIARHTKVWLVMISGHILHRNPQLIHLRKNRVDFTQVLRSPSQRPLSTMSGTCKVTHQQNAICTPFPDALQDPGQSPALGMNVSDDCDER